MAVGGEKVQGQAEAGLPVSAGVMRRSRLRGGWLAAFFLAPAGVVVLLFFVAPFVLTVLLAFTDMDVTRFGFGRANWVGFQNFAFILDSRWTPKILGNTLFYVAVTLACFNFGLALVLALITTQIHRRSGFFFRTVWLLPRLTPSVVYVMIWNYMAANAPYGIANSILAPLGVEPANWLSVYPWLWVVLANGFVGASFGMIIFSSAIEALPTDQIIASRVDGASTLQTIVHVILPKLRWPMLFVAAYQTLSLLTSFEQILLLTDGGPGFYTTEVWALHAYHQGLSNYWGNQQIGYGSAMATFLVVIGFIMALVYLKFFRFNELVTEPKIETQ